MLNTISLEFSSLDVYNLAIYNNKIPLIDEIIIKNDSDFTIKNLEVEISSSPSFFNTFVTKVSMLSSGRYVALGKQDLEIDLTKIMYSSEPSSSTLAVRVKNMGEVIAEFSKSITILPYDYLPPVSVYTELISSFVTPNQEDVKSVAGLTLQKLKETTNVPINSDMWNYNDPTTIKAIVKAIYSAICDLKITLNTLTPFSETKPFKVKLAETVISTKSANSLELSLLTASVSELLGLNSFLVFAQEKVFVGFFYTKKSFDTIISDDSRALQNLVDGENENLCVVDTTSMIYGTQVLFENSLITAQKYLEKCDCPIVIDIAVARLNNYTPLPNRIRKNGSLIFEIASENKPQKDNFYFLKSSSDLAEFVKNSLSSKSSRSTLLELDTSNGILLIGNSKNVISKLILNGKVLLNSFPFSNSIENDLAFLDKLVLLNDNLDSEDVSNSVNVLYNKDSLHKRTTLINNQQETSSKSVCLALNTVKFTYRGRIVYSPLVFAPISFEVSQDNSISIKLLRRDFIFNSELIDELSRLGLKLDLNESSSLENYERLSEIIVSGFAGNKDFTLYDVVCVSTLDIYSHSLSSIATEEYFKKGIILQSLYDKTNVNDSCEKCEQVYDYQLPYSLDKSQVKAVNTALNNNCTIIQAPNGSGRTRVAAAIAFSELKSGKRVLYLTSSEGNLCNFTTLAKDGVFSNQIMYFTKEAQHNSFDYIKDTKSEDVSEQLREKEQLLFSLISEQDSYFNSLHKVNEIGFSLYEAASQYERYRSFPYSVNFTNSDISKLSRDDVVVWFDAVSSISKAGADCKEPFSNPLSFIREKDFSYELKSKAIIALSSHISVTNEFIEAQNQIAEFLGVEVSLLKENQTGTLLELLKCVFEEGERIYHGIFSRSSIDTDFSRIEAFVLKCDDFFELKDYINTNFTDDVCTIDCEVMLAEWRNANSKFAFSRSSALGSVRNKLKAYTLNPKFITNDNVVEAISKIARYKSAYALIDESSMLISQTLGIDVKESILLDDRDVFLNIEKAAEVSQRYLSLLSDLYDSEKKLNTILLQQSAHFKNFAKFFDEIEEAYIKFNALYKKYTKSEMDLLQIIDIDFSTAKALNGKIWYYFLPQFLSRMLDNIDLLKYWCNWNVEKEKAIELGLESVVKLYESEQLTSSDIKNSFLKGFFKSVTEYLLSCEEPVSTFSFDKQNETAVRLYAVLSEYRKLLKVDTINHFVTKLEDSFGSDVDRVFDNLNADFSEEINAFVNKEAIDNLQQAKPCFVASSVVFLSKFRELPEFDTVIIDTTSDKIQNELFLLLPIVNRAVVISSCDSDNYKSDFVGALLESGAELVSLDWIYNTGYPSRVVNEMFYNNSVSQFITTQRKKNGLRVIRQNGSYDRRKTRVNVIEASTVVDEILKYQSEYPNLSVGVYTMTEEQRDLIELLYQKRLGGLSGHDSFFIRVFSDAEYDKRDIIIFSTVYSLEEKQKYAESLTKTMPELADKTSIKKFINILSSSREKLLLVTSLNEDILAGFKTTEKNYCVFKKIIQRLIDKNNLFIQDLNVVTTAENSIIRQVANHIESLGYKVDLNLGINDCIIDIAVRSKDKNDYVLGIVFDENVYIHGNSFLNSDLILNGLENFGKWKIFRIYTVEWFENHTKQLDILSTFLNGDTSDSDFSIAQKME